MKPMNFPGRRQQRQLSALQRLEKQPVDKTKAKLHEIKVLSLAVASGDKRDVRTKKGR